jgi:uncharacterized protein
MTQPAKVQEPTMEEILASIRRIIADDDAAKKDAAPAEATKPVAAVPVPPPKIVQSAPPPPPPPPPAPQAGNNQDDIDVMLAELDAESVRDDTPVAAQDDVLELTESMATPAPTRPVELRAIEGKPDAAPEEKPAAVRPATATMVDVARRQFEHEMGRPSLLSATTSAAVDSAFNSLANTVLVQNARTLEDLVREMLRPMLKAWLDDNLPGLVERMVRAEIERVSRGRS